MANHVYTAARDGKLWVLKMFARTQTKEQMEELVSTISFGATPLVMACRNGHYDVAEYLIDQCGADIEQPGAVLFDGDAVEGAPPLWCAAAAGHLNLVELLVSRGANVNSTTKTNSTPLRAACFDGHYDIIKRLVRYGADIEMANRHGHTPLMIACYRGHIKIVKLLLELKVDTNRKSVKGNTALHDCAESGSLEILKVLIEHGARMDVDSYGMTPLFAAAVTGQTRIVEYLISMPNLVSRKEAINALELLGATYVDKKKDMIGAFDFWKRAMEKRYPPNGPVMPKPPAPPVVLAYDFTQEVSNPDALDELLADPDEMRMQALVIRERILGPAHPDTSYYIRYRGAAYADAGKFDRCIELWNYALDMQQRMLEPLNPMTQSSLFSFTELFSFMMDQEGMQTSRGRIVPAVPREEIIKVLKKAVSEVRQGKLMLDKVPNANACECDLSYMHRILVITLHLACLLTKDLPDEESEEYFEIHKTLYDLIKINARGNDGRDVLLLAHAKDNALVSKYPICEFPCPHLTKALLRAGADVSSRDNYGNTVLHLESMLPWDRQDILNALLDAGAHPDAVNDQGRTFYMLLRQDARKRYKTLQRNILKRTTLACLAARVVIRTHTISSVPHHLRSFVQLH